MPGRPEVDLVTGSENEVRTRSGYPRARLYTSAAGVHSWLKDAPDEHHALMRKMIRYGDRRPGLNVLGITATRMGPPV